MPRQQNEKWYNKLRLKYRLVIFDDETYEKIVKDEPSRIKTMDELMARKAELVKSKETLSTYAKLTDEEVLHQWGKGTKSADKVEDFRARNADLSLSDSSAFLSASNNSFCLLNRE